MWVIFDVPALPRTTVKVSEVTPVTKTISSLIVSGSNATVNWSTFPAAKVTPPSNEEAVPVAVVMLVAVLDIPLARVVSILMLENLRVIYLPYFV